MICQKCGKNKATTHIKTVINGKVAEQSLCGYCAAKSGYSGFAGGSISNMLASMLGQSIQVENDTSYRQCGCCGTTFADIAETGKVGCAQCYKEFNRELRPYLKRIHGSIKHVGKTAGKNQLVLKDTKATVSELKAKLASLVAAEKYEEAAVIRDEIKKLEGNK